MTFIPGKNAGKIPKGARKSKYGNKRVEYMGKMFDSIGERDRYIFLKDQEKRGKIKDLRCQVSYSLDVQGVHICRYVADFVYITEEIIGDLEFGDGTSMGIPQYNWIVEDFKGVSTAIFKLKAKLMLACHGISVRVVKSPTDVIR